MYESPKAEQIKDLQKKYNLTGSTVAKIVGVDSRTVRKWTASNDAANRRSMPWSAWILLNLYIGELTLDELKAMYEKMGN